jgi:hypothetical protein
VRRWSVHSLVTGYGFRPRLKLNEYVKECDVK